MGEIWHLIGPLLAGMACGMIVSFPVGPVGILVLLKLSEKRRREAEMVAIGSTLADTLLALLASLGVAAVVLWLVEGVLREWLPGLYEWGGWQPLAWTVAAVAMWGLAWVTWRYPPKPPARKGDQEHRNWLWVGFVIAGGHPGSLAAFAAAFSWMHGLFGALVWPVFLLPPLGVLLGAALMWFLVIALSRKVLRRLPPEVAGTTLRAGLAWVLVGLGVLALGHGWWA